MKKIFKIKLLLILSLIFSLGCSDDEQIKVRNSSITNFNAESLIEAVTLSWDVPSGSVNSFIISYEPGEKSIIINDGTINQITIEELEGGSEYTFSIWWIDNNLDPSEIVTLTATPEVSPLVTFEGDLVFGNQSELDNIQFTGNGALQRLIGNLVIVSDGTDDIFDLSVLEDLILVTGNITITDNPILSNLDNLSNLTTVEGNAITIQNNRNLYSLCGIANITGTNMVSISGNDFNPTFSQIVAGTCKAPDLVYAGTLTRFNTQAEVDALPNGITHFPGELVIGLSAATNDITDLSKFSKVRSVAGRVLIQFTPNITNLLGFRSLASIGTNTAADELVIRGNANLATLNGLQALNYVARRIGIRQNPALQTLEGINNLREVGENNIAIGVCGNSTAGNPLLTDYCALQGVIQAIGIPALELGGSCIDSYSTFNPSFQDVINGNCSN